MCPKALLQGGLTSLGVKDSTHDSTPLRTVLMHRGTAPAVRAFCLWVVVWNSMASSRLYLGTDSVA